MPALFAGLLAVALLPLGACGGGDDESDDPLASLMLRDGPGQLVAMPMVSLPPMLGPFAHGGPLAIHMGPEVLEMDVGPGAGLADLLDMGPFAELARVPLSGARIDGPILGGPGGGEDLPATIFDLLDRHVQQAHHAAKRSGDFDVKRQGDRMQLTATMPDFKDSPPTVEVVGNSLVVRGQQASGHTVRSFQRSFQLPRGADVDAIHVEFSKSDGKLSIDVPINSKAAGAKGGSNAMTLSSAEEAADGLDGLELDPLAGGSQMTIMFSAGGEPPHMPFLDPFVDMLLGHGPLDGRHHPSLLEESGGASSRGRGARRGGHGAPPPLAVQGKNAKPFWRVVNGAFDSHGLSVEPAIEIVAPRGVDLGKVEGKHVATYNSSADAGLRGQRVPMGQLDLPVSVGDKDCQWSSGPDTVSPWLPLWMLGGTGLAVGFIVQYLAARQRSAGKMSRKLELKLIKAAAAVSLCCLLMGLALSAYLLHRHRVLALEERVMHCRVSPDAIKKVGVHVKGEL